MKVLVTGTGHCGTHSFQQLLEECNEFTVRGGLGMDILSKVRRYQRGDASALDEYLRSEYADACLRTHALVDHNSAWALPLLLDVYPDCKVVFLMRRAYQCINGLRKHHGWDRGFVDMNVPCPQDFGEPAITDKLERTAWFWAETNKHGKNMAHDWEHVRVHCVEDDESLPELFKWMGMKSRPKMMPHVDGELVGVCPEGSERLRQVVETYCSGLMDELYPGWREENDAWEVAA